MIGTIVGHFRLVGYLGAGASGTVYRAVDEVLGREVALKILNPGQVDPDAIARFRAEATTLATLNHPGIATIYELLESDGHLAMAMQCVRGETLDDLCDRIGALPPERAAHVIERVLAALDHAHRAGILHRDMKPANVMVNGGDVTITDFGIAQVLGSRHVADEGLLGTPDYMAPEQVLGEPLDQRTDLYAVGVILYRLLTATLPFHADSPAAVLKRQIDDAPPPLQTRRGDLPAWCEPVVQRALAKRKADRFQTADEFRAALTRAAAAPPRGRSTARRLLSVTAVVGLVLGATIGGLLAFANASLESPITPTPPPARDGRVLAAPAAPIEAVGADARAVIAPAPVSIAGTSPAAPHADTAKPLPERDADKPAAPRFATLEFDAKALVADGGKTHEHAARLVLADRTLSVIDSDAGRPLYSVPYDSVTSINYSNSRDPLWASPEGPAPVIRTTGGVFRAFGIFVNRKWVSVVTRTDARFIVLRVADGEVTDLLTALRERTHRTVQRLEPKRETAGRPVL